MSSLPLLYSYRRCPYAMRARMALLHARRPFDVVEIVLRDKPAELLALSPKGTVPVLHLPDGRVIDESWDIMRWALAADDADGMWARAHSAGNLALLEVNDGEFKQALDRCKYPERFGGATDVVGMARARARQVHLEPLERRLQEHRFLGGDTICATDLALLPFVRQFAAVEVAWWAEQPWPAVRTWLAAGVAGDLFTACMARLPPGQRVAFPL